MKHIFLKLVSNNHSSFQKTKEHIQNRQSLKMARKIAHSILDEMDSKNIDALKMSEILDIPLFELEDVLKGKSVLNEGLINKIIQKNLCVFIVTLLYRHTFKFN